MKNSYVIIKTYTNHLTLLQVFFACLDMWICFFTINGLDPFEWLQWKTGCVMWNYWLQYIAGIVPWLIIQHYKTIRHGFIFNESMNRIRNAKRSMLTCVYIILCNSPAIVLCVVVSIYYGVVGDNQQYLGCGVDYRLRLGFLLWVVLQFVVMIAVTFIINRGVKDMYSKDYDSNKHIAFYGLCVSVFLFVIQNLELLQDEKWKMIYICVRSSFFLVAFYRSMGFSLFMSALGNRNYMVLKCNSVAFYDVMIESVSDISHSKAMIKEFLSWMLSQDPIEDTRFKNVIRSKKRDTTVMLSPKDMVRVYRAMREWREKMVGSKSAKEKEKLWSLLDKMYSDNIKEGKVVFPRYVLALMRQRINLNVNNVPDPTFFTGCERFILDSFDHYWGYAYICNDSHQTHQTQHLETRVKLLSKSDSTTNSSSSLIVPFDEEDQEDFFVIPKDSSQIKRKEKKSKENKL